MTVLYYVLLFVVSVAVTLGGCALFTNAIEWLGKRLGSTLAAPNLASQGFQLVGGRLLTGGDGPAALLMYQREDGKRITLYIVATGQKERTDLAYAGDAGVGTLYWKDGDLAWALSGEIDREKLVRLAHLAYGQSRP